MNLKDLERKYETFEGDPEAESLDVNHKADDIRGIIRRCGAAVLSFEDRGYGVEFRILRLQGNRLLL